LEARKAGMELRTGTGERHSWGELIGREYGRHDFAASELRDYAAGNEAEFFAVASEVFFEDPWRLRRAHPALYSLLVEFYGQDPGGTLNHRVPE
jgi:Mlc titration factor MtfA (ptsG expression regulator)